MPTRKIGFLERKGSAEIQKTKREQIKVRMYAMAKNYTYFDKNTSVRGKLTTSDVVVEGTFEGKIHAEGKVLLKRSVNIEAEIVASKFMVEDGVQFTGNIFLSKGEKKPHTKIWDFHLLRAIFALN